MAEEHCCDHCDCEHDHKEETECDCKACDCDHKEPKEKVEALKKAISLLGFQVEETEEGIKISE